MRHTKQLNQTLNSQKGVAPLFWLPRGDRRLKLHGFYCPAQDGLCGHSKGSFMCAVDEDLTAGSD